MSGADGTIQVYEKGIAVGPLGKAYQTNDVLGIAVEELNSAPTVRYYVNSECPRESQPTEIPFKRRNLFARGRRRGK